MADILRLQMTARSMEEEAQAYINPEKEVQTAEAALAGAMDIVAEAISDEAAYRKYIRDITMGRGILVSEAKDANAESVYEMYYDFSQPVSKLAGHRILALNRGGKRKGPYCQDRGPCRGYPPISGKRS